MKGQGLCVGGARTSFIMPGGGGGWGSTVAIETFVAEAGAAFCLLFIPGWEAVTHTHNTCTT